MANYAQKQELSSTNQSSSTDSSNSNNRNGTSGQGHGSDPSLRPPVKKVSRLRWRAADIALGAALGVACGIVFWGFNFAYAWIAPLLRAVLPGITSLFHAFWYFSGPLALLIIRKPGAAIYVDIIGSLTETLFGNQYSFTFVFISAMLQGLFAEVPFAIFRYKKFNLSLTIASGALTAVEYGFYVLFTRLQGVALVSPRGLTHMTCEIIGGILIAGVMSWFLYLAIARTGALDHFASGRAVKRKQ